MKDSEPEDTLDTNTRVEGYKSLRPRDSNHTGGLTRRRLVLGTAAGTISLAGCLGGNNSNNGVENGGNSNASDGHGEPTSGDDGTTTEEGGRNGDNTGGGPGADTVPVRGDPDAAVTLEVFEDFGCPHCAQYNELAYPDIEDTYLADGRIRYEHRDFVITGSQAQEAANAAREVLERHSMDDFWAFAARIFSNQGRLAEGTAFFSDIASDLGLDGEAIAAAGADRLHQDIVDADFERGRDFGVQATPSFVINDELVDLSGDDTWGEIADTLMSDLDAALEDAS